LVRVARAHRFTDGGKNFGQDCFRGNVAVGLRGFQVAFEFALAAHHADRSAGAYKVFACHGARKLAAVDVDGNGT
jgi:hypothetical protein